MTYKQKLIRILGISGWTRDHLADLLGTSNSSFNGWLSGKREPREKYAEKIDRAYDRIVKPFICDIELLTDEVEGEMLKDKIANLSDDNVCDVSSANKTARKGSI